jgi:hypothetical protein
MNHDEHPHGVAAEESDVVAVEGAILGAGVAVGGVGGGDARAACFGTRSGAAAAMHAAAQLAVDGRGSAGAAGPGAGAATGGEVQVRVAAAVDGWWGRWR